MPGLLVILYMLTIRHTPNGMTSTHVKQLCNRYTSAHQWHNCPHMTHQSTPVTHHSTPVTYRSILMTRVYTTDQSIPTHQYTPKDQTIPEHTSLHQWHTSQHRHTILHHWHTSLLKDISLYQQYTSLHWHTSDICLHPYTPVRHQSTPITHQSIPVTQYLTPVKHRDPN